MKVPRVTLDQWRTLQAVVDHGLQGSPLIEGHTWHFHSIAFLLRRSGTLAVANWRSP